MAVWRGLGTGQITFRPPGESIIRINRNVSPEQRRARELRRRVDEIEERKREERFREGDW